MSSLKFDLDIDKHQKGTVVISCPKCHHEIRHHLESLEPDMELVCTICDEKIVITQSLIDQAKERLQEVQRDEGGFIG